jgi:outer membrane protein OmpA-like peptidoglycan-associated protein
MKRLVLVTAAVLVLRGGPASAAPDGDDDGEEETASDAATASDSDSDDEDASPASDEDRPVAKKKKKSKKHKRHKRHDDEPSDAASTGDQRDSGEPAAEASYNHVPPRAVFAGELLGATPLDKGNRDLFGMGGGAGVGVEVYVSPLLGIHAGVFALALTKGDGMSSTNLIGGQIGPRVHFAPALFGDLTHHDAWIDAHFTYGSSGGIKRPGFDVAAALQWEVSPALRVGPVIRYEFGKDPRDTNAQLVTVGLAVGYGGRGRTEVHIDGDEDGDGITDANDVCPAKPAGANPDPKREGCPVADSDSDGVLDAQDECPDDAAGDNADPRRPGCPIVDTDGDSIADTSDRCPKEPGPANPFNPANNGCPELARVVEGKIEILQQIFFETDSATIKDESFPVLEAVASTIKGLDGARVRVEGHTDQQGSDEYNLDLSKRRARAVAQWLIQNGGIDPKLLETEGYGRSRPIVSGKNADLALNRRVEFVILRQ